MRTSEEPLIWLE